MKDVKYHARLRPFIESTFVVTGGIKEDPVTFADIPEVPNYDKEN